MFWNTIFLNLHCFNVHIVTIYLHYIVRVGPIFFSNVIYKLWIYIGPKILYFPCFTIMQRITIQMHFFLCVDELVPLASNVSEYPLVTVLRTVCVFPYSRNSSSAPASSDMVNRYDQDPPPFFGWGL